MPSGGHFRRVLTRQYDFGHLHLIPGPTRTRTPKPLRQVDLKFVQPKNRIAAWNIEPGDRVFVRSGSMKGHISLVESVARHTGQVYLKGGVKGRVKTLGEKIRGASTSEKGGAPQSIVFNPHTHYSNLSLVLANGGGDAGVGNPPLVATRLNASRLRYSRRARGFNWRRTPEAVRQLVYHEDLDRYTMGQHVDKPVNALALKLGKEKRDRDMSADHVALWTSQAKDYGKQGELFSLLLLGILNLMVYRSGYPSDVKDTKASAATKDSFLSSITQILTRNASTPELQISKLEFGNPDSRARRTDRWNAKHRNDTWHKIPKPMPMRRFAKIRWDKGLKRADLPVTSQAQIV